MPAGDAGYRRLANTHEHFVDPARLAGRGSHRSRPAAAHHLAIGGALRPADRRGDRRLLPVPPLRPRPGRACADQRRRGVFGKGDPKLKFDVLVHVLLALAVVIVTARALGSLFAKLKQPPVIGEVLAGILLGPSLLGRIAPVGRPRTCCRPRVAPFLSMHRADRRHPVHVPRRAGARHRACCASATHATVAMSHASIVAAVRARRALALWLYPRLSTSDVPVHRTSRCSCGVADVGDRVPGAGAHPDRPRHADARAWASSRWPAPRSTT